MIIVINHLSVVNYIKMALIMFLWKFSFTKLFIYIYQVICYFAKLDFKYILISLTFPYSEKILRLAFSSIGLYTSL